MLKLIKKIKSQFISIIYELILIKLFKNKSSFTVLKGKLKGTKIFSPIVFNQMFGNYEKNVELFLEKELNQNSGVIDIGAYNGYTGFLCQKIIEKLGSGKHKVFLIEANRDLYLNIIKAIEFNKIDNVIPLNYFINDDNSKNQSIYIDKSNMIQKNAEGIEKEAEVQYLNFENLITKIRDEFHSFPNVLILDIEGFEYDLIRSKIEIMKNTFNIMIIEYHSKKIFDLIHDNFTEFEYSYYHRINNDKIFNGHFFLKKI